MVLSTTLSAPILFLNVLIKKIYSLHSPLVGLDRESAVVYTIHIKFNGYVNKPHKKHNLVPLKSLLHEGI